MFNYLFASVIILCCYRSRGFIFLWNLTLGVSAIKVIHVDPLLVLNLDLDVDSTIFVFQ